MKNTGDLDKSHKREFHPIYWTVLLLIKLTRLLVIRFLHSQTNGVYDLPKTVHYLLPALPLSRTGI